MTQTQALRIDMTITVFVVPLAVALIATFLCGFFFGRGAR